MIYERHLRPCEASYVLEGRRHQVVGIAKITGRIAQLLLLPILLHGIEALHVGQSSHAANRRQSHFRAE